MRRFVLGLFIALAPAACASRPPYAYLPATYGAAQVGADGIASSEIPPEVARGEVRVANLGIVRMRPQSGPPEREVVRGLHVRLVVANRSLQPWTLDMRQQRAVLPGYAQSRAAYAWALGASPPFLAIPPGDARTLDLVFPLPAPLQTTDAIPTFDLVWEVATGACVPSPWMQIVPYEYGGVPDELQLGGEWFNPSYDEMRFAGAPPLPRVLVERGVLIEPAPPVPTTARR